METLKEIHKKRGIVMKRIIVVLVSLVLMVTMISVSVGAVAEDEAYINIGDYNSDVIALHQKLADLGYYYLRAESPWSAASENAVKILQENLDLPVTGIVENREQYDSILNTESVIGKNLLEDYEAVMTAKGYQTDTDTYENNLTLHCDNRTSDSSECKDIVGWSGLPILPNTDYTLSFYAKGEGVIHSYLWPNAVRYGESEQGSKTTAVDGNISSELSDEWKTFVITWRTMDTIDEEKRMLPVRVYGGNEVYVSQIKLEAGYRATDWN